MVELTYFSLKKTSFFVRILDISHCVFTQISIDRARWIQNLILHPMSTHTAYFWWTSLPQKQEIPKKMWWWHHHHVFSGKKQEIPETTWWWHHHHIFSGISGFCGSWVRQSMPTGYLLDAEFNFASNDLSQSKFE